MIAPTLTPRWFAVFVSGSIRRLAARLCFRSLVIGCLSDQFWICLTAWLPISLDTLRPGIPPGRITGEYAGLFYSVLFNSFVSDCVLLLSRLYSNRVGGDEGIRTPGLRLAKAALSQLSYIPRKVWWAFHPTGVSGLPEFLVGGPSRIRTWDLSLIRGTL